MSFAAFKQTDACISPIVFDTSHLSVSHTAADTSAAARHPTGFQRRNSDTVFRSETTSCAQNPRDVSKPKSVTSLLSCAWRWSDAAARRQEPQTAKGFCSQASLIMLNFKVSCVVTSVCTRYHKEFFKLSSYISKDFFFLSFQLDRALETPAHR